MAGLRKGVSVVATVVVGVLATVAQAGEDPAKHFVTPNAAAGRMAGDERGRSRPPAQRLPAAGGGEVAAPPSDPPIETRRASAQTTLEWLQRFGTVDTRPIERAAQAQDL